MSGVPITKIQKEWIIKNALLYSEYIDLTNAFNSYFNLNYTKEKITRFCQENKIVKKQKDYWHVYSQEEKDWLREHRENYISMQELTDDFNAQFNTKLTKNAVQQICMKNNIYRSDKIERNVYTEEFNEWIKENVNKYSYEEIAKIAKEQFNINSNDKAIRSHTNKILKITKKDNGQFTTEKNSKPLGHEFVRKNAVYIKVKHDIPEDNTKSKYYKRNYRRKANVMYEQYHNVKLDDKIHYVVCIDRNIHNFDKDNLMLLNKKEFNMYIGKKLNYEFSDQKLNKLLLEIVKLEYIVKEGRKEDK